MADISAYQAAAKSIYEPQKQAEVNSLTSVRDTTKNALESQKGQVNTNYQDAINQLTQSIQDQTGQINQLYSQQLGGNFSGLQGNDLGQMFSRANQQQGIVEQTRANKLGEITAAQTNADIEYGTGIANLTPKYQSLESAYANDAYGAAAKAEQDQANKDRDYALSVAKFKQSSSTANQSAATTAAKGKAADTLRTQLNKMSGRDGYVSPYDYSAAKREWQAAGYSAGEFESIFSGLKNPKTKYGSA